MAAATVPRTSRGCKTWVIVRWPVMKASAVSRPIAPMHRPEPAMAGSQAIVGVSPDIGLSPVSSRVQSQGAIAVPAALAPAYQHIRFGLLGACKLHKAHRLPPAMAASVADRLWEIAVIVRVLEDWERVAP